MSRTFEHRPDLAFLFEASHRLNRVLEFDALLGEIRDLCVEAVNGEAVSLLIWNEDRSRLEFQLAYGHISEEARRLYLVPGEGLAGWIAANDQAAVVNDASGDERCRHWKGRKLGFETRSVVGVPIHRGKSVMGVVEVLNKKEGGDFTDHDVHTLDALADPIAVALENAILYRDLKREKAENDALYRIGLKLNQTLDLDETLSLILDLILDVLPYDAAGIALVDGDSLDLEVISFRGYPADAKDRVSLKVGQGAMGWVVKTGEPLTIPDVSRDDRYVVARPSTKSELTVPIQSEGKTIGALNLENDKLDAYRPGDSRMLMAFANQAAISVQRARMHREVLRRQRLQDEVEVARAIQESLLPSTDPELPGYHVSGSTTPCLEVGGDSYDLMRITDNHLGLTIGDVSGKGIPAAFILASFRAAMRTEIRHNYEIRRIYRNVNWLLHESTRVDQFVTAVYGVLDLSQKVFTYANAGHNPPILLRQNGEVEWLTEGGLILGLFEDYDCEQGRIDLNDGDLILFYTDGAVEAVNARGEEFGEENLLGLLRSVCDRTPAEIRLALEGTILRHSEGIAQDDVTLVVLKVGSERADMRNASSGG